MKSTESSAASNRGANYHGLYAKETRHVITQSPIYRVECACGWMSGWTIDWDKSLTGHIYREQRKARRQ